MVIAEVLKLAVEKRASDIHLTPGVPPVYRIDGQLVLERGFPQVLPSITERIAQEIIPANQIAKFYEHGEVDFAYSLPGVGRFRVNAYRQRGSVALAMRLVNSRIPTLSELGMPAIVSDLARRTQGLVLVTGPTGSGKSTTLAAMVGLINSERSCHIITLEDPIEYLHQHQMSIVNQREIGTDSESFAEALRAALRQDPDVIMVGEMRDLETIATAVTAAETGHLVLATLHTANAAQTVDRIIDIFPPHQQQQIRVQLADVIEGVISQQLLARRDQPGRVAAVEIMVATPAIRSMIREGKNYQILSAIQTGARYGMQTMDMALRDLYRRGIIALEDAAPRLRDSNLIEEAIR